MNIKTLSRLFGALVALLLLSVSFTLVSCGDDDEDDNGGGGGGSTSAALTINGEEVEIDDVLVDTWVINNVKCYAFYLMYDGNKFVELDVSSKFFGKTYDLTKDDLSYYYWNSELDYSCWWLYICTGNFDTVKGYVYDNDGYYCAGYWYNEEGVKQHDPTEFKSGSYYGKLTNTKLTLKTNFVTIDKYGEVLSCSINYEGSYTILEEPEEEGPKVKAEFPMQMKRKNGR